MINTNRAGIFYKNLLETAASITATSEASASTPVANLATFQPGEKWRSADTADQTILINHADEEKLTFGAGIKHNFGGDATIRYRISNNSDLSDPAYDATFYVWASTVGWDEGGWNESGWDGVPVIADLEDWQYRFAHFLDLIVEFEASDISVLDVDLPQTVRRIGGGDEDTAPSGLPYLGAPISAPVQRKSHSFTRASSQYLHISNADFGAFDAGRILFQAEIQRYSTGTKQRIIDKQQTASSDESFYVEITAADKLHVEVFTDGTDGELLTTATYTGTTDFMVVTVEFDKNEASPLKLYVDGTQITAFDTETQPTGDIETSTGDVYIGSDSAGANTFDGLMHNVGFFSGALPSITQTVCGNNKSCELATITNIHSLLAPGTTVNDYVLSADWTNVNGVALSSTAPENYNQIRYVESAAGFKRTLTIGSGWSVPPQAGDTMRIDMTGAIETAVNDLTYSGTYHGITISDADNADGYLEMGYLAVGGYIQPQYDVSYARDISHDDPSLKFTSFGGTTWVTKRTITRRHTFQFGFLTEDEAIVQFSEMASINGASKPIVWLPFCENSGRAYQGMGFGLLNAAPTISQVRQDYTSASYSVNLTLNELR